MKMRNSWCENIWNRDSPSPEPSAAPRDPREWTCTSASTSSSPGWTSCAAATSGCLKKKKKTNTKLHKKFKISAHEKMCKRYLGCRAGFPQLGEGASGEAPRLCATGSAWTRTGAEWGGTRRAATRLWRADAARRVADTRVTSCLWRDFCSAPHGIQQQKRLKFSWGRKRKPPPFHNKNRTCLRFTSCNAKKIKQKDGKRAKASGGRAEVKEKLRNEGKHTIFHSSVAENTLRSATTNAARWLADWLLGSCPTCAWAPSPAGGGQRLFNANIMEHVTFPILTGFYGISASCRVTPQVMWPQKINITHVEIYLVNLTVWIFWSEEL